MFAGAANSRRVPESPASGNRSPPATVGKLPDRQSAGAIAVAAAAVALAQEAGHAVNCATGSGQWTAGR